MWLLCGYCVATVWLLCGCCVATVWLLCGYFVASVWLLCCVLWIRMMKSLPIVSENNAPLQTCHLLPSYPRLPHNQCWGRLPIKTLTKRSVFFASAPQLK